MLSYEEIYKTAENTLSEKRFYHSKCVVDRAIEYAEIYGENKEKAKIAGICHDIAKEIPKEEILSICEKYGVSLDETEKENKSLIHGKLGAKIAEVDFGCTSDICNAIKYHTTGKENMSLLEKIIFIADCTGIDREYDNTETLYELAKKDLNEAMILYYKTELIDMLERGKTVHIDSIKAYNFLIK